MIKISIIVPCYNLGEYLDGCLYSITKQICNEVEIIFIDDGSSDDTPNKLKSFCECNPNCLYLHQHNSGVSSARNIGIKHAKGEYIYILDGDDILTNDSIKTMLSLITTNADIILTPEIALKQNQLYYNKITIHKGIYSSDDIFSLLKLFPTSPKLLYKTEIIKKNNIKFDSNISLGEVFLFTLNALKYSRSILVSNDYLFYYVTRSQSATHKSNYSKDLSIINTVKEYLKIGKPFFKYPAFWLTIFQLCTCFNYFKYKSNKDFSSEACRNVKQIYNNNLVKKIIRTIVFNNKIKIWDKRVAIYIYLTGTLGFKLLKFI